jgi:hypothetical protein
MNDGSQLPQRLLRRSEAAQYLKDQFNIPCEASSLRTMAHKGTGPAFQKFSRFPLYAPEDLDSYAASKMSPKVKSTSELTALRAASTPAHVSP